ncbi:MAG: hypothetical protein O2890_10265 [Cyanobacteria bacterium]|nr:hypothetical protein [Cyanobacteriota bacterium]MDA0866784.1 hypothetical protein [Cyanobacteriota bacterium]
MATKYQQKLPLRILSSLEIAQPFSPEDSRVRAMAIILNPYVLFISKKLALTRFGRELTVDSATRNTDHIYSAGPSVWNT